MGHKRDLISHYRRLIALRDEHPEQPLKDFCRSHSISAWTYYHWRNRLNRTSGLLARPELPPFLPIRVDTMVAASLYEVVFPSGVLIRAKGELPQQIIGLIAPVPGR